MAENVSINLNSLSSAIDDAAYAAARTCWSQLDGRFTAAFSSAVWPWPRDLPTRKLNGATLTEKLRSYVAGEGVSGGSPRTIVDFGRLSQSKVFNPQGLSAEWRWTEPYASYVQHGAMIRPWGAKNRRVFLPPRDWERAVLGDGQGPTVDLRYDLRERFQTFLRIELKRRRG
jgi:hypothetical protein